MSLGLRLLLLPAGRGFAAFFATDFFISGLFVSPEVSCGVTSRRTAASHRFVSGSVRVVLSRGWRVSKTDPSACTVKFVADTSLVFFILSATAGRGASQPSGDFLKNFRLAARQSSNDAFAFLSPLNSFHVSVCTASSWPWSF